MAESVLDMKEQLLRPLGEDEVVIHVPPGSKHHVRIQESNDASAEILVQVSKHRKPTALAVLGVIVK